MKSKAPEILILIILLPLVIWAARNIVLCFGWAWEDANFHALAAIPFLTSSFVASFLLVADTADRLIMNQRRSRLILIPCAVILAIWIAFSIWQTNVQMVGLLQ
jgi:hypothetical protein